MLDARQDGLIPIADVERVLAAATEMFGMETSALRNGSPQQPHQPPPPPPRSARIAAPPGSVRRSSPQRSPRRRGDGGDGGGGGGSQTSSPGTRLFKASRFDRFSGFGGIRKCRSRTALPPRWRWVDGTLPTDD